PNWRWSGKRSDAMKLRLASQVLSLLNRRQRKQAGFLLGALVVRAAVELVGVAGIAPFMSIVADPSIIQRNGVLRWCFEQGEFVSETSFLIAVGAGVVIVLALSNGVSALSTWAMYRFVWGVNHELSNRLLRGYLAQPYSFFVQRNSATLHK